MVVSRALTVSLLVLAVTLLVFAWMGLFPNVANACHGDCGGGEINCAQACDEGGMANFFECVTVPMNGSGVDWGRCKQEPDAACGGWGACRLKDGFRDFLCDTGYVRSGDACIPACASNQGQACQSAPNMCGMQNTGTIQCSGACSASPPPNSLCGSAPIGNHEGATCNGLSGWAFDDDYAGSIDVRLYEGSTFLDVVTANQPRPGVGATYPGRENSGWSWTVPLSLKDATDHTITAYAVNVDAAGNQAGSNPALSNTPRTINCTNNVEPEGFQETATCSLVTGWARDENSPGVALPIRIFRNGPAGGGGILINTITANIARPDLPYLDQNHGYAWTPPEDGASSRWYLYTQDPQTSIWHQLVNSPTAPLACYPPPAVTIIDDQFCSSGPGGTLTWDYTSSGAPAPPQGEYQVQVAPTNRFATLTYDSGRSPFYGGDPGTVTLPGVFSPGETYFARVKAWERTRSQQESDWSPTYSLTIPPDTSFTLIPAKPPAGTPFDATDTSVYGTASPVSWLWDMGDGTQYSGSPDVSHTYASEGDRTVTLTVTDSNRESCSISQVISINPPIPEVREVLPQ